MSRAGSSRAGGPGDKRGARRPVAEVDALVNGLAPQLTAPAVQRVDAVLVTGPWLAGVSSVAAALAQEVPEHTFVEAEDLRAGEVPMRWCSLFRQPRP